MLQACPTFDPDEGCDSTSPAVRFASNVLQLMGPDDDRTCTYEQGELCHTGSTSFYFGSFSYDQCILVQTRVRFQDRTGQPCIAEDQTRERTYVGHSGTAAAAAYTPWTGTYQYATCLETRLGKVGGDETYALSTLKSCAGERLADDICVSSSRMAVITGDPVLLVQNTQILLARLRGNPCIIEESPVYLLPS